MKNMINKFSPILGQLTKTTLEHSQRVAKGCSAVATMIGVDSNLAFKIGYLHDVGKIYIPSRILSKNGKLTATERSVIDLQTTIACVFRSFIITATISPSLKK